MKPIKPTLSKIGLLGIVVAISSLGNNAFAQDTGGRHHRPPAEAYTACEGKSEGDTASFESPQGDTVTGTCVQESDQLVLRPDNPPGGRRNSGPRN